jgi:hypothetical protein
MMLFTVETDGAALGIASTETPDAALKLVGQLCRAQETASEADGGIRRAFKLSARRATESEEGMFRRREVSGCVRLAGFLIGD